MTHLNREELIRISIGALHVLQRHGVIESVLADDVIEEEVNELVKMCDFVLPFHILDMSVLKLTGYNLQTFDDCNIYQEEGYYREKLEELSKSSGGRIQFSDVEERWKGCQVTLSFKLNAVSQVLEFDVSEEDDMVPEPFVAFQLELLKRNIDGWTYVLGGAHEAASRYYALPVAAARELEALEAGSVKK